MDRSRDISPAKDLDSFLAALGERVRMMRARRGMSRKALAKHSDVSERYLAQLEAGKGNCSIVLLRRIASAMSVPLAGLVDERPERSIEHLLLAQFLDRLSTSDLAEARETLLSRFGGPSSETRQSRIALIGLRGSGKSTIGQMLSAELGLPFIELDRVIEQQSGMALAEIFEMFGQETFRRMERAALETSLQANPRFVLATGGSLVTEPGTFELLLTSCLTVWLRARPNEHMNRVIDQGDLRPMADNARAMDDLVSILSSREPLYAKADLTVDTTGKSPQQSVGDLVGLLGRASDGGRKSFSAF
ncbi:MAG TPA: helix-turn-helix transcriptional regulator [Xanthobacteraceae bacterium]|jgi:XRE family aerobic/anaerobic benzoate catabolism transcriptional regulator|nr:helix-turn-helix transcriptional regulator [Xanthobacteraceae bacterium]